MELILSEEDATLIALSAWDGLDKEIDKELLTAFTITIMKEDQRHFADKRILVDTIHRTVKKLEKALK